MTRRTLPVSWVKAARKEFETFQKRATQGIKTPKREIDLIKGRLKKLKEMVP